MFRLYEKQFLSPREFDQILNNSQSNITFTSSQYCIHTRIIIWIQIKTNYRNMKKEGTKNQSNPLQTCYDFDCKNDHFTSKIHSVLSEKGRSVSNHYELYPSSRNIFLSLIKAFCFELLIKVIF